MNAGYKPLVLVVDDNVTNLKILNELLSGEYRVRVAFDGESAIRIARASSPDIILLDIMMPGMDGFETCQRLKADRETSRVPVMFLTAKNDPESEERGLAVGAIDYLQKPFLPGIVKARIANHLELKILRDTLEDRVSQRTNDLERVKDATILGMALLAEYRDRETGEHIRRVRLYMRALGEALLRENPGAFPAEDLNLLASSAMLHDIGKVAIPDTILLKPGPLTPAEFEVSKGHPAYGAEVLRATEHSLGNSSFLRYAIDIAQNHHEKWDGSGYPAGLRGEDIPMSARLMALVDVYDALVSRRVYKEAMSHDDACRMIMHGSGRTSAAHFDPRVLAAFGCCSAEFARIALNYCDWPVCDGPAGGHTV